ncbi:MAG: hypothetical protein ACTSR4_09055, partial [Candidatus Hodarchaeales archaeon]
SSFVANLKNNPITPRTIKKSDKSVVNIRKISMRKELGVPLSKVPTKGVSNRIFVVKVNKMISMKIKQNATVTNPSIPKITEYPAWYFIKHFTLQIIGYFFQTSGFPHVLQFLDVSSDELKDFHQFFC